MMVKLFGAVVVLSGMALAGWAGFRGAKPERSDCCGAGSSCCYAGSPCCDDCCYPGSPCCYPGSPCCGDCCDMCAGCGEKPAKTGCSTPCGDVCTPSKAECGGK